MMRDSNIGDVILVTADGKKIGEMQTLNFNFEREHAEIKSGDDVKLMSFTQNRFATIKLEDVEINEEYIGTLLPTSGFTVVGTGYKLPKGKKLPKKKRLRKKFMKKYQTTFTLENCRIIK